MNITAEQVTDGQAIYTKDVLNFYDFIVLDISNQFIWKCPTQRLVQHYNDHVSANHLDVGVGTGCFLHHCYYPTVEPRIALMDLNPDSLEYAYKKILRYKPEKYQRNVLETISINTPNFDSVGINYLLHCIPGSIRSKAIIFDNLKELMNHNAVIFGSTLFQGGVPRSWLARRLMGIYNKKGVFSNQHDSLDDLEMSLNHSFRDVSIDVVGCVAVFSEHT